MVRNKKKSPGRPKKEFVSKKPQTPTKEWPGRPRKHEQPQRVITSVPPPAVVWFVEESVDTSKKKDIIILVLFLMSFLLFIVSLYFTFMKEKKVDEVSQANTNEITNINTGNIDYSNIDTGIMEEDIDTPIAVTTGKTQSPQQTVSSTLQNIQTLSQAQQMIIDFYQAINVVDMDAIYTLTDARLEDSTVFKTYYSRNWLNKFSEILVAPKVIVTNIQEKNAISNPNIKEFTYTLEYVVTSNQQKFTEEWSTILIKKGDNRKIGKLLCETKGCSTMPFFNPDKYK